MIYKIPPEHEGRRLLDFLKYTLQLSHAEISALKRKDNGITLNGEHVTVRAALHAGDDLSLATEDTYEDINQNIVPAYIPLDIIYEDDDLIAVNKRPGMPTHPSHNHYDDTLANALAFYYKEKGIPFVFRAVNRLDAETGGIVLVAKSKNAAYRLQEQIICGKIEKRYLALVHGNIEAGGVIKANIKRKCPSIIERAVCSENEGKYAETHYSPIASRDNKTLLDILLITGRTHQIRVHMAYIGHPICADTLYGDKNDNSFPYQALHCASLSLELPCGKRITLNAPPYKEMAEYIKYLKEKPDEEN